MIGKIRTEDGKKMKLGIYTDEAMTISPDRVEVGGTYFGRYCKHPVPVIAIGNNYFSPSPDAELSRVITEDPGLTILKEYVQNGGDRNG